VEDGVPGEVLLANKSLGALVALKGLGALVHVLDVHRETHPSVERLVADVAGEAVLAGVVEDVAAQLARLDEALSAVAARVRLDARVRLHVTVQSLLCRKFGKALK